MTEKLGNGIPVGEHEVPYHFDEDEALADEFDALLPDDPKTADWHRVAYETGNRALIRNRPAMQRLVREVHYHRLERKIRHDIIRILKSSGGTVGLVELMRRVDEIEGQAGANAAIGLVYIMQAEGTVKLDIERKRYEFTTESEPWLPEDMSIVDDNVVVRLLRKH